MDPGAGGRLAAWNVLMSRAGMGAAALSAPVPFGPAVCQVCYGPVRHGSVRCFPCELHAECASGWLASVVVPVAYAPKGGSHARSLWLYKSGRSGAQSARRALAVLLVTFLREHGGCVWRQAGWPGPTHLAVVPSGRGRGGPHPLRGLAEPYLRLPWASISARPGAIGSARDLDPRRFRAARLDGARVLLLDDTWTSGASAQSATMALRGAGAAAVAVVVLGRHLARARPGLPDGAAAPFSPARCAVHDAGETRECGLG